MPKLLQTKCPNCGAAIDVDPKAQSTTCEYCGQIARIQRKTMFGRAAVPLDAALRQQKVIYVSNIARRIVLLITLSILVVIGVAVFRVVRGVQEVRNHTAKTATGGSMEMDPSKMDITVHHGNTTIRVKDGKVVADIPGMGTIHAKSSSKSGVAGPSFFETPLLVKRKFLGAIGSGAKATKLVIRRDTANLQVIDGSKLRRYEIDDGEVGERRARPISAARRRRTKTFSLATLDLGKLVAMIARAKSSLSGSSPEVTHVILEKSRKGALEWRVYGSSSDDRKMLLFDGHGKLRRTY